MTNKSFDELNHYEKRLVNLVVRAKDLDNHDEDMFNGSVTEVAKIFLKYEKYRQFNAICDYYRDKFNIERRIDELKDKISYLEDDLENHEDYEYNEMYNECDEILEYDSGDFRNKLSDEEKIILGVYE